METKDLLDRALRLPREDRTVLATELLASLERKDGESEDDETVERAWLKAALDRLEGIRSGRVQTIPADEVDAEVRARLSRAREARQTR